LRAERGWSLYQAAKRAGMSPWALSLLEHRRTLGATRVLSLMRVAEIYGVTVDYLIRDLSEAEPASLAPV
jgi:transcriptional regulator with XRE-family HTH domain